MLAALVFAVALTVVLRYDLSRDNRAASTDCHSNSIIG
jgi:hypothetical protein